MTRFTVSASQGSGLCAILFGNLLWSDSSTANMKRLLLCIFLLACLGVKLGASQSTATTEAITATTAPTTQPEATTKAITAKETTASTSTTAKPTTAGGTTAKTTAPHPTTSGSYTIETSVVSTVVTVSTAKPTSMSITTHQATTLPPAGRYEVNGTDGTCILMQFHLHVDIPYNTTSGTMDKTSVEFLPTSTPTGNCSNSDRFFTLTYPGHDDWHITFDFNAGKDTYEMTAMKLHWKYEEPFFTDNAVDFGKTGNASLADPKKLNVRAAVGKTFKCKVREVPLESVQVTLMEIMYQPYADQSKDKGNFGDIELCAEDKPTNGPIIGTTKAPEDKTGMIVGIIIGCIGGVVLILGGVYFFMRHRHKRESYKSLE